MRTWKVWTGVAVFVVVACVVWAQPAATIWSNTTVATSAKYTSATLVQPASGARDVGVLVALDKGTATNVVVAPAVSDGATTPTWYPVTASAATVTANGFVNFAAGNFEAGQPVVLSVTGTGDVSTTAPVLVIKAKIR